MTVKERVIGGMIVKIRIGCIEAAMSRFDKATRS